MNEPLFSDPDPDCPDSVPPNLDTLGRRVIRRRRNRRMLTASVFCASAMGAIVLTVNGLGSWRVTSDSPTVLNSTPAPVDAAIESDPKGAAPLEPDSDPPIRVWAKVYRPVPVFGVEEETQSILHVGWIDSEEIVPVDMSQFPAEQQRTFEATLRDDDSSNYISL